jgi:hypothetical protein
MCVCVCVFFFFFFFFSFFFPLYCWFTFLYFCFFLIVAFFFFFPLFPYTFSFMFLLVIRLYLICPILLWSRPWVVDVNNFLAFELKRISFGIRILLLGPRNKRYLCIGWCLFGAYLILNLMYSHGLVNAFGYG